MSPVIILMLLSIFLQCISLGFLIRAAVLLGRAARLLSEAQALGESIKRYRVNKARYPNLF